MRTKITIIILGMVLTFFNGCIQQKNNDPEEKINLVGSTWISIHENLYAFTMVSFIDEKVAYIVMHELDGEDDDEWVLGPFFKYFGENYFSYENINVGTRTVNGKVNDKDWKFTFSMDNENLTLNLPRELNEENYNTIFSKRLTGNNLSQPTGIWINDTGVYFLFTNSGSRKKFGLGTYVSWDYTCDDTTITWSGNKGAGIKPFVIDKNKGQIRLILPGNDFPITLTNVSNEFITIF